jgi:hypothetical protein
MNKKKLIFWGVVLLIGVMLTGCAGNYGGRGYNDGFPYYDYNYTPGYGGY